MLGSIDKTGRLHWNMSVVVGCIKKQVESGPVVVFCEFSPSLEHDEVVLYSPFFFSNLSNNILQNAWFGLAGGG